MMDENDYRIIEAFSGYLHKTIQQHLTKINSEMQYMKHIVEKECRILCDEREKESGFHMCMIAFERSG